MSALDTRSPIIDKEVEPTFLQIFILKNQNAQLKTIRPSYCLNYLSRESET